MRRPLSHPPAPGPRVLVVGGGPFQLDIIRTAKDLGARVAVADRNPDAPGLALADHPLAIDVVDSDRIVDAARAWNAEGVVTAASDAALFTVATVGEALGLRAIPIEAARRCRDKLATFEYGKRAGLAVPETECVTNLDEAMRAVERVGGFPVVVKPRSAAGGRGVSVVHDRAAMQPALARASGYDHGRIGTLVQRFVGGDAIGVEAFFWSGALAAIFVMDDQFVSGFVSPVGHSLPSMLAPSALARVHEDVARFADALGLCEGPANFDLRLEHGRTVLLEVNARLGGNSITDLVRVTHGVDMSEATVRAALGVPPDDELRSLREAPTAVRLLLGPAREGCADLTRARAAIPEDVTVDFAVRQGEPLSLRVDEHAILGRCIVRGDSTVAAAARARDVADAVSALIEVR